MAIIYSYEPITALTGSEYVVVTAQDIKNGRINATNKSLSVLDLISFVASTIDAGNGSVQIGTKGKIPVFGEDNRLINSTIIFDDVTDDVTVSGRISGVEDAEEPGDAINKKLLDEVKAVITVGADYVQPIAYISYSSTTVEKGTTLTDISVNVSFTQYDAGSPTNYSLLKDDVVISTVQNNTITLSNIVNTIELVGEVDYLEGPIKNNNLGEPSPAGRILAGTINSASTLVTPRLKSFSGGATAIPTDSAQVRALPGNQFETTSIINIETGVVNKNFIVAVPFTKGITSVIDTGNLNLDITSAYVLAGTFDVEDAGGNLSSYRVYAMTIAVPYPVSTNHKITIG